MTGRLLLLVDNYDSFTFNLAQLLRALAPDAALRVVPHDAATAAELVALRPWRVVISPGPSDPSHAGVSVELLRLADAPVLGVCLGHQCLAVAFGGRVVRAPTPVHGKADAVLHDGRGVFAGMDSPFEAARYHSLVVDPDVVPACLEVSARTRDGVVMGLRHRERPLHGVQFHPESVLSPLGPRVVRNFLDAP